MNRVNEKICRSEKSQGHRGHRKVKCEISQALVMIYLYVTLKLNVHYNYAKQVIVLKVADIRTQTFQELTLKALHYFCVNHGDQRAVFNLKSS